MESKFAIGLTKAILLWCFITIVSAMTAGGQVVLRNTASLLPLKSVAGQSVGYVSIGGDNESVFLEYCQRYDRIKTFLPSSVGGDGHINGFDDNTPVIAAVFGSSKSDVAELTRLLKRNHLIVCFFVPGEDIEKFVGIGRLNTVVIADGCSEQDQIGVSEAVFGGQKISGRLTYDISGFARKGEGVSIDKTRLGFDTPESVGLSSDLPMKIDSIVKQNIEKRSFPGCQVVIVKDGQVVVDGAYGHLDYSQNSLPVTTNTLYDIASMTKATATVSGLMKAFDYGLYRLDGKVSSYLPVLSTTDKANLTVKDFLYHETGIPATVNTYALMVDSASFSGKLLQYRKTKPYTVKVDKGVYGHSGARLRPDLFKQTPSNNFNIQIARGLYGGEAMVERMRNAIYQRRRGEKKYLYSCLNFCILKDMEEALTGVDHDLFLSREVFDPIGASYMMFRPVDAGVDLSNIAPTETDNFMRKQKLRGFVHDEMAAYLGGVSGNAGLFSNALDVAKLCQTWLNGGSYAGRRIFNASTVELFTKSRSSSKRGLGFDTPARLKSMSEAGMPESSYGHTGFTGTCFWVDPENDIIIVILCNRVCPSRDNASFNRLNPRGAIVKAVYDSIL